MHANEAGGAVRQALANVVGAGVRQDLAGRRELSDVLIRYLRPHAELLVPLLDRDG